jgi:hypothetical protein
MVNCNKKWGNHKKLDLVQLPQDVASKLSDHDPTNQI